MIEASDASGALGRNGRSAGRDDALEEFASGRACSHITPDRVTAQHTLGALRRARHGLNPEFLESQAHVIVVALGKVRVRAVRKLPRGRSQNLSLWIVENS